MQGPNAAVSIWVNPVQSAIKLKSAAHHRFRKSRILSARDVIGESYELSELLPTVSLGVAGIYCHGSALQVHFLRDRGHCLEFARSSFPEGWWYLQRESNVSFEKVQRLGVCLDHVQRIERCLHGIHLFVIVRSRVLSP